MRKPHAFAPGDWHSLINCWPVQRTEKPLLKLAKCIANEIIQMLNLVRRTWHFSQSCLLLAGLSIREGDSIQNSSVSKRDLKQPLSERLRSHEIQYEVQANFNINVFL
ncbi:hypothetical protein CEXT_138721 [Caerostris extrusa]|uniref:Uncharacterized protein n=1 Tax=Caerostris extrusa TaxID=172846 RepID=A0AAV4R9Q2_CAEEX|nr:hypothetical protein CEXT_138721 [Caerostris extrusa]